MRIFTRHYFHPKCYGGMLLLTLFALLALRSISQAAVPVLETTAMNGSGDVADDPALWLHPTDPSKSVILGTNKSTGSAGGLYLFDLNGDKLGGVSSWNASNWFSQGKRINTVDVRYNFHAGNELWDIVSVSNRTDNQVDLFRVDRSLAGDFSGLTSVGSISTTVLGTVAGDQPYGNTLFHSKSLDKHFLVANSTNGNAAQWELTFNSSANKIEGQQVWFADLTPGADSEVEGVVADDEREAVYFAAEDLAIYRYDTSGGVIQDAGRVTVDTAGGRNLTADIEGLTLYYAANGDGYLLVSSQGSNNFHVYDRNFTASAANAHLGSFNITSGNGVDGVTSTDGIAVVNSNLGGEFATGLFIAHDGSGDSPTNYKLVAWGDIAGGFSPDLLIDTTWDPRAVPEPMSATMAGSAIGLLLLGYVFSRRSARHRAAKSIPKRLAIWLLALPLSFQSIAFAESATFAGATLTPLNSFSISATTSDKPQSKLWMHDGDWWTIMPDSTGTWLRRLDGDTWNSELLISSATNVKADILTDGDLTHILLFNGSNSRLASLEYLPATDSYGFWSLRPALTPIPLTSSTETATIALDTTGRLWIASDNKGSQGIEVRYSDATYTSFSSPISIGSGITTDDIAAITALPGGKVGVLWSDQNTQRFYFREHVDRADPSTWSSPEIAAAQSALNIGAGMADDHINFAVASDGTLYVAMKTSYDSSGRTKLGLLVRRPSGQWDDLYHVDFTGTRPIVLLDESINRLIVAYTAGDQASNIVYRESPLDQIQFSSLHALMTGNLNDVTSMKQTANGELVLVASGAGNAQSVMLTYHLPEPNTAILLSAGFLTMMGILRLRG